MKRIAPIALSCLTLAGCVTSLAELRESEPVRTHEVAGAADALSACTLRAMELEDLVWNFRLSADPVTHRHDLTATRLSDIITMKTMHVFEASFIHRLRADARGAAGGSGRQ